MPTFSFSRAHFVILVLFSGCFVISVNGRFWMGLGIWI